MADDHTIEIDGEVYEHLGTLKEDAFARTDLVAKDGKKYVFKLSRLGILRPLKLSGLMKRVTAHEARIHKTLEGLRGVARLAKQVGDDCLLREFVEGRTLDRNPPFLRPDFFDEFFEIVKAVHARGVALVDIAKKENVVVTEDGRPFLIDFQISIQRSCGRGPISFLWNCFVRRMQRADVYHLFKHKRRIRPDLITQEELNTYCRKTWSHHLYTYLLRKPYHLVKRRFIPKHGDSRYPYYEKG